MNIINHDGWGIHSGDGCVSSGGEGKGGGECEGEGYVECECGTEGWEEEKWEWKITLTLTWMHIIDHDGRCIHSLGGCMRSLDLKLFTSVRLMQAL